MLTILLGVWRISNTGSYARYVILYCGNVRYNIIPTKFYTYSTVFHRCCTLFPRGDLSVLYGTVLLFEQVVRYSLSSPVEYCTKRYRD